MSSSANACLLFCLAFFLSLSGAASTFQGLGFVDPSHDESLASGVSADGLVVVGVSRATSGGAPLRGGVRWHADGSFEHIPMPAGFFGYTIPTALSENGEQVVGYFVDAEANSFQWNPAGGSSYLSFGSPAAMSDDGTVIVGGEEALVDGFFIWAAWRMVNGQKEYLGGYPQTFSEERGPRAVTPDGSLIAGYEANFADFRIFIWEAGLGFEYLESQAGWNTMYPSGISADGKRVAGITSYSSAWEAVIWRRGLPPLSLGDFPGGDFHSGANAISRRGHLVVGFGTTELGREAAFWDPILGMQHFGNWITSRFGVNLDGWILREIAAISADNRVIAGAGTNPDGLTEAWVLRLDGHLFGLADYLQPWSAGSVSVLDLVTCL